MQRRAVAGRDMLNGSRARRQLNRPPPGEVRSFRIESAAAPGVNLRVDVDGWNVEKQSLKP